MTMLMTKAGIEWVEALADKGLFVVGADGRGDLTPAGKKILGALHEVLAGGDVDVVVKRAGTQADRDALDAKLDAAIQAANLAASGPVVFGP